MTAKPFTPNVRSDKRQYRDKHGNVTTMDAANIDPPTEGMVVTTIPLSDQAPRIFPAHYHRASITPRGARTARWCRLSKLWNCVAYGNGMLMRAAATFSAPYAGPRLAIVETTPLNP